MPLSVVLRLSTPDQIPAGNLARQAQAWFLKVLREKVSADLAQQVHEAREIQPFTVSDLFERAAYYPSMNAGAPYLRCLLRLTCIDENLASILTSFLEQAPPSQVEIWWLKLRVEAIFTRAHEHEWAGDDTYAELSRPAGRDGAQDWLEFVSPTSFHSEGGDLPLPLPALVFRSCWRKWNEYSRFPIRPEWLKVVDHCIQINRIVNLNTQRWKFAEGGKGAVTGFVGKVRYSLADESCRQEEVDPRDAQEVLATLKKFAFYCGVGRKTSWGLGQARRIAEPARRGRHDPD